jgi:two-component system response regulator AlgR
MSATRVLIVDDETPARNRLRSLLAELDVQVVGEAARGSVAVEAAGRLAPDIVLLDIHMPGMSGLETARHLAALSTPPAVIFATAFDDYALQAFEAQAIAYLLKPVRKDKLAAALGSAARLTRPQIARAAAGARALEGRSHVAAKRREGIKLIPVESVFVFLAEQKCTRVRHAQGEDLIEDSLRTLEAELGADFVRIHRAALISARYLDTIERDANGQYCVRLRGIPEPLPVSRRMAAELRGRFAHLT